LADWIQAVMGRTEGRCKPWARLACEARHGPAARMARIRRDWAGEVEAEMRAEIFALPIQGYAAGRGEEVDGSAAATEDCGAVPTRPRC
jgi:hypothetical protein